MTKDYSINQDNPDVYVSDSEDIKQCWKNILRIIPGTIPLMPRFGSDLYKYADLPVTKSFSEASNTIIKDLSKWESRTKITKVTRTVLDSKVMINIFGIYSATGEAIVSQENFNSLWGNSLPVIPERQAVEMKVVTFTNADLNIDHQLIIPYIVDGILPGITVIDNDGVRWTEVNMIVQYVDGNIIVTFPGEIAGTWTYQLEIF